MRRRGRVLRAVGGSYTVEIDGAERVCALRGRLKREEGLGRVAVGDLVEVELLEDDSAAIAEVLPRATRLSRRTAHGDREQIIAANVERLAAVLSVAEPEPNLILLDRLLVVAELSAIEPFIVANKVDLAATDDALAAFREYESAGYRVVWTSAVRGAGIPELAEALTGRVTAFVGPSGAGKSTLLNAIEPGLGLRVGAVSRGLGHGKHTTVEASLHPLTLGGYVADTPGLRKLRLWEVPEGELDHAFREFRPHLGGCRFPDCRHLQEPGCAVRAAVERGEIAERRHKSYAVILAEKEAARPY